MKIKIITDIPVAPAIRPKINEVYEVVGNKWVSGRDLYFIMMNGEKVGVFSNECEVISEN